MGNRVYVGNVPYNATEDDFMKHFSQYNVRQVKIITDRDTGRPRGFAFVELADHDEVLKASEELNGSDMGGRAIVVNEAEEKKSTPGRRDDRRGNNGGNSRY